MDEEENNAGDGKAGTEVHAQTLEDGTAPDNVVTDPSLDDLFTLDPDVKDAFEHDPFPNSGDGVDAVLEPAVVDNAGQPAKDPIVGEPTAGEPGEPAKQPEPVVTADAAKPGEPAAEPVPDAKDLKLAELQGQIASLTAQVNAAPVPVAVPAEVPKAEGPNFLPQVPDNMMAALNSEDPAERKVGVQNLVSGTAHMVYGQVMKDVQTMLEASKGQIQADTVTTTEAEKIYADFYQKFPTLDKESFKPMVMAVTRQVYAETKPAAWSEALRDAIGNRVIAELRSFAPTPPAGEGGSDNGGSPSAPNLGPAALTGGGTRPTAPSKNTLGNEVEDVIFGT